MRRRLTLGVLAAGTLAASAAFAMDKGTVVYVRARDTKAYPLPKGKGRPVTLEPSAEGYAWQDHDGPWNQIKLADGKLRWVYGPNLALTAPKLEVTDTSDLHHSTSSGMSGADAIKGLGDGAQWYAGKIDAKRADQAIRKVATSEAISIKFQPTTLARLSAAAKGGAK